MFIKHHFYEPYHIVRKQPQSLVNSTRKALLHYHDLGHAKDYCRSDVLIQINNPPLSSKGRIICHMHKVKHSFSNADFKAIYDLSTRSAHFNSVDTPVLTRVSVSSKKLNHIQYAETSFEEVEDFPLMGRRAIPSVIEELAAPKQYLKRDEEKERRERTKKAANYLRNLGKSLKVYYKKCSPPESPSPKSFDGVTSFESSESETKESKVQTGRSSGNLVMRGDKLKGLHKDVVSGEKSFFTESLAKTSKGKQKRVNVEAKKETKKIKKKHRTATSKSSGLTFAEKMELLAIGPILN